MPNISVLILAAGASTRMGKDIKQLLPWQNTTLLESVIDTAGKVSDTVFVVLGAHQKEIEQAVTLKAKTIFNPDWKTGMGSSISIGIKHILKKNPEVEKVLIMLADQPLIDTDYLSELVLKMEDSEVKIVATAYGKGPGVPAIFNKSIFPELERLHKDFGARNLMKKYGQNLKTIFPKGKEEDIDTFEDYHQLVQISNTSP